jgi:DNA-binding beta-propeller fold protein YncE
MKRLMFVMMFLMLIGFVWADEPIGVFVNSNTNSIHLIDPLTQEATVNYLGGELGSYGGGLFDVVITPNGKTAIVSNFGDSKIFFIDISGGFDAAPVILGSTRIGFFAEDMAITPDGKYVLVTDGGFSARLVVVDIAGRYLLKSNNLGSKYANAVDITPDGQTVVVADYFAGAAHCYKLQADGSVVFINTAWIAPFRPVNVAISPDGKTVILVNAGSPVCTALTFDSQGYLCPVGNVAMPFKNGQSCVFNSTGDKAYYLSNSQNNGTKIVVLNVTGPGQVAASGTNITIFPRRGTSQLFGVDTIAIDLAGDYLYVTNPTLSGGIQGVAIVDLATDSQVSYIKPNGIPTGIAFGTIED